MTKYSKYKEQIKKAAAFILDKMKMQPQIAVVLGSGLSSYADYAFSERGEINYSDIPYLPITTVSGHRSKLYYGHI